MLHKTSWISSVALMLMIASCSTTRQSSAKISETTKHQAAEREFRAAWVASVANINWPSRPGLPVDSQKQEAIGLLNFLQQHNYNAVIFQVRPQADALYDSQLEPWSYYLTGEQGKAPDPYYDPLKFWIEEAHNRGLELHVWLNPYRAHHISGGPVTAASMVKKQPELMVHLKEGYWWYDPALKATQDHGVKVVMDIVKRYDIDGVHFDDYFYPYTSYNGGADFPDTASRRKYVESGGTLSIGDWRRQSVNQFIERLYQEIKKEKKHVKFGLSPFGIWRPGHPPSIEGMDQYDQLYADAKLWLNEGWVDYFSPQLYWPIGRIKQSFPVLLGWWSSQNLKHRHLWPGISVGRDTTKAATETLNQIMITRGMLPQSSGVIHWSISSVTKNPAMARMLAEQPYARQALVPASPWLDANLPATPQLDFSYTADSVIVHWKPGDGENPFRWALYYEYGTMKGYRLLNRNDRSVVLSRQSGGQQLSYIGLSAVSRISNESLRAEKNL